MVRRSDEQDLDDLLDAWTAASEVAHPLNRLPSGTTRPGFTAVSAVDAPNGKVGGNPPVQT